MNPPFFSIITPTLLRNSLVDCCGSVNGQMGNFWAAEFWEHIVMNDSGIPISNEILDVICDHKRRIIDCPTPHKNYGNTCRHEAWKQAKGKWVIFLDDDNIIAHAHALQDIATALWNIEEQWAIFPIMRHGRRFFHDPPGCCYVDTANMVIRREIGQWPDGPEYTMDGIFCDQLKAKYPYAAFPDVDPIIVMEKSNEGK